MWFHTKLYIICIHYFTHFIIFVSFYKPKYTSGDRAIALFFYWMDFFSISSCSSFNKNLFENLLDCFQIQIYSESSATGETSQGTTNSFFTAPSQLTQKHSENVRWEGSWNVFMESFLNVLWMFMCIIDA